MFEGNLEASGLVRSMMKDATVELFGDYKVKLDLVDDTGPEEGSVVLCGVMGFTGSLARGSCLLAGTEIPFNTSKPSRGVMRDWVGELTNQLVGRLKIKLLERGVEIALSTPVVLQGEHIAPLPRRTLIPLVFEANPGRVFVWVELETVPNFELSQKPTEAITTEEGDALFF